MKYALFGGEVYYPGGGASDFKAFGDDIDELKLLYRAGGKWDCMWAHIAEVETMKIVCSVYEHGEWKE